MKHSSRTHRVADFNDLSDLIEHAVTVDGATHVSGHGAGTRLYFPSTDGKYKYEVASVWQKGGYWHAQGPSARTLTQHLPRDARYIPGDTEAPRRHVRDYEAIDSRDRVIAGPFKTYGDAKDAAGGAGVVRFVPAKGHQAPPRANETGRRESLSTKTEAAGEQYAYDQISSDHFTDWVSDQIAEASRLPEDKVLPLETKADALIIAKNMLQQLRWDAKREVTAREIERLSGISVSDASSAVLNAFWEGFQKGLDASRDGLADELLELKAQQNPRRASEPRKKKAKAKGTKKKATKRKRR